jgi:RNA polymerase sigma factor (sigma-70 family)
MNSTDTFGTTIISKATDEELFAQMAKRVPAGKEAWAEFYHRYVGDLYKHLFRRRTVPMASVEDWVQETMIKAYWDAHNFQAEDTLDAEAARRRTLGWLGRIARNLYLSTLRQQSPVDSLPQQDGEDDSQLSTKGRRLSPGELHHEIKDVEGVVSGSGEDNHISPSLGLLHEALDSLSDVERDILIATFEYYQRGQKQQRLPHAVVEEICETYNISPDNLRQVRGRAIKKIEQYFDAHMPTEN